MDSYHIAIRQAWAGLRRADHAEWLLRTIGWRKVDALAALAPMFASQLDTSEVHALLDAALQAGLPLVAGLDLIGARHVHSGPVTQLAIRDGQILFQMGHAWLQVHEEQIYCAWIVRTPGRQGVVHTVELFDAYGQPMLTLADAKAAGGRESCEWRQLLARFDSNLTADCR